MLVVASIASMLHAMQPEHRMKVNHLTSARNELIHEEKNSARNRGKGKLALLFSTTGERRDCHNTDNYGI